MRVDAVSTSSHVSHLARGCSDHCLLLIKCNEGLRPRGCFHFLNVWTRDRNFLDVVKDSWE